MTYEIILWGKIPSKKNLYTPIARGGKAVFIKNSKLQKDLDAIICQVPGSMRGLNLEHPEIDLYITVPTGASDRDNIWVCLSDILVSTGVCRDDNIKRFNGRITIHPAVVSDHFKTVVVLNTASSPSSSRASSQPRLPDV